MGDNDLSALLLAAEQLTSNINDNDDLPKTNRTLTQLVDSSNKLFSKLSSAGPQDADANLLLSSKGIDLTHLTKKVENIASQEITVSLDPFPVVDITNYLSFEKENAVLSIIDHTHHKFNKILEESIDNELDRDAAKRRNNLLNNLDQLTSLRDDTPLIHREIKQENPLLTLSSPLNQNQILYASALVDYNLLAIKGRSVNLMDQFKVSVSSTDNETMKDIWDLVTTIGNDFSKARDSPSSVDHLIKQARSYLEKRLVNYIESSMSKNRIQMQRGGIPGNYSLILAYVKTHVSREYDGMERILVDGLPFWPVCYYCIRCGNIDDAIQAVVRAESDLFELSEALKMLKTSPNLRLPFDLTKGFRSSIRNSLDPYKRIIYCILGVYYFDDKDEEEVIKTADDYFWFQLCVVVMPNQKTSVKQISDTNSLSYESLQTKVVDEYGELCVRNTENSLLNFRMLFLTGHFELAIDSLFRNDRYYVHAVHVAIALAEQELLALPDRIQRPLISTVDGVNTKCLNLCTLIKMYIQLFQEKDVEIALHYCFCLRNIYIGGSCVFPQFVVEFALETQQYDRIFGHILEDGCRVPGYIDKFFNCEVSLIEIIRETANELREKRSCFDAVKLYNLCNDFENLLKVANSTISTMLTNPTNDPSGISLIDYVRSIMSQNIGKSYTASVNTVDTFNVLLDLLDFFQLYNAKQYKEALNLMQKINLIPLHKDSVESTAEKFRHVDSLILRTISDVVIAVMKTLVENFKETKSLLEAYGHDKSLESHLQDLQEGAEALISFAGTVPYQLPSDTSSKLVRLKISMI